MKSKNEYFFNAPTVLQSKKTMSNAGNENKLTSSWKVSQFVQLTHNKQISGGIELTDKNGGD